MHYYVIPHRLGYFISPENLYPYGEIPYKRRNERLTGLTHFKNCVFQPILNTYFVTKRTLLIAQ